MIRRNRIDERDSPGMFDLRHLRDAFGTFLTGVTVVTCRESDGTPRGFTANSFTSVSLDPPLLLICVDKAAESFDVFTNSRGFSVNILSEHQAELSDLFASKRPDKFEIAGWKPGSMGYPILEDVCAWFECTRSMTIDAGDHVIIVGEIQHYDHMDSIGLGYVRGGYMSLGLERSAAKAAGSGSHAVVGAVIEHERRILLFEDEASNELYVPASGLDGEKSSLQKFQSDMLAQGINLTVSSLFAVFENEESEQQSIYYRALAESVGKRGKDFWAFGEIPWDRISSHAVKTMVRRYISESSRRRFGIYFGSDRDGSVETLVK